MLIILAIVAGTVLLSIYPAYLLAQFFFNRHFDSWGNKLVELETKGLLSKEFGVAWQDILAMEALEKEITHWTADDLGIAKNKVGIKGSFTRIRKTATPDLSKGPVKMIKGDLVSICDEVEAVLKKNYLL